MARISRDLVFSAVIVTVSVLSRVVCQKPCHYDMSVNITGATKLAIGLYVHNNLMYTEKQIFEYSDNNTLPHKRGCVCLVKTCIRKCCPIGQLYLGNECVVSNDSLVNPFNPPVHNKMDLLEDLHADRHFGLVFGEPCSIHDSFVLNPYTESDTKDEDAFFIQADGNIFLPNVSKTLIDQMNYCVDAWATDPNEKNDPQWTTKYLAVMCYEDKKTEPNELHVLYLIGLIISVPFLVATFLVYALIAELQNLHGKTLMSYVFGLAVAYTTLAFIFSCNYVISDVECYTLAFVAYFSFMLSFFWLNVMCFDIWWTFSGYRAHGECRSTDKIKFFYYCLYAWGFPLILTSVCAIMQFHPNVKSNFVTPGFGNKKCWFPDKISTLLYFYTPMIILIVVNFLLFGSTTWIIIKEKRSTAVLRTGDSARHTSNYNNEKQRFYIYLKLFFIMGINWSSEWISSIVGGSRYIWILTDLGNILQGIFIFMLFVCTPKVKALVKKRYSKLLYGKSESRVKSTIKSGSSTMDTERSFISSNDDLPINMNQLTQKPLCHNTFCSVVQRNDCRG